MSLRSNRRTLLLTGLLLALAPSACDPAALDDQTRADPLANFDALWRDFDRYYGLFDVKGIDWSALSATYRPRVGPDTDDAELYAVFADLLGHLHDTHVSLYPAGDPELPVWNHLRVDGVIPPGNYDHAMLRERYLTAHHDLGPLAEYGRLAGDVGYVHLKLFDGSRGDWEDLMDTILADLGDAPGLVVDVRDNPGGLDPLVQYVAGRFAAERALFMTSKKRSGPAHDDFTPTESWYVEPTGAARYTGPVVLLTSFLTQSAGETFTLAMRTQPHVTQLGEPTNGAMSDNVMRELPNGWLFTISVGDYRGPDGESYEGTGVPPDVAVYNTPEEVLAGQDRALEQALSLLSP